MEVNRNKRIVLLRRLPSLLMWGGLEKLMLEWAERIDYKKCHVILGISKGGRKLFGKRFAEKNLPIEIIEFPFDFNCGTIKIFNDLFKFLKLLSPTTVIFIQGAFADFRLASVLAAFLTTRGNVYMHENLGAPALPKKLSKYHWGIIPGIGFWWYKQIIFKSIRARFSQKVFVVSQEIMNQLTEFWGYPKHKIAVAYHGVNLRDFSFSQDKRQKIRRILSIPNNDFVFIIAARLSKEKCIDRAINAFDLLSKKVGHKWLLVLGDGNLKQELQELAQQKSCKNNIIFLGHKDNVAEYLNAADCFINSSDKEGLGISLLEAMASEIICIATHCTGPNELIQRSQSGFLVDRSVEGVLWGMQKAVSLNAEEREALTRKGIQFIRQHFEVNQAVQNIFCAMQIPHISLETADDRN